MKAKNIIFAIVLYLFVFVAFFSHGHQQVKWKGTIEKVDGVTIVKNPKKPMYGEDVLTLEEELTIGEAKEQTSYIFGRIAGLAVDEKGHIYVADDIDSQIKVFNENGVFLRTIGRSGQGPGEIGSADNVFINSHQELIVPDRMNRNMHFYSLEGKFLKDKSFGSRFPMRTVFGPQDQLFVLGYGGDFDGGRFFEVVKLNDDLNAISTLHRVDVPPSPTSSIGKKIPHFCVRSDGNLLMGFPKQDEYQFKVITPQGETERIISRKFDPFPIPKELLEKAKKALLPGMKVDMPSHFSSFARLFADEEGRAYVLTAPVPVDSLFLWDVFDTEGKYLAAIKLPGPQGHLAGMRQALLWKEGKLYTIKEDDDGYEYVKRYKVTWKY